MQVYKFGGTSVGNAARVRAVKYIINDGQQKIVVLSANGKTTDQFVELITALENKNFETAFAIREKLFDYYMHFTTQLFTNPGMLETVQHFITITFIRIQSLFDQVITDRIKKEIIANGELISTQIFSMYLIESGLENTLLYAPGIIQKNADGQVDLETVKNNFQHWMEDNKQPGLIITQGFICKDQEGNIDNLGRGGSDYSASIFGVATASSQIQIWSDVDGFLCNDPGFVDTPPPLEKLSFDEAAELAYFGARVLHPSSLRPAKDAGIPVLLKNTYNPLAIGTVISNNTQQGRIKAVAAKDGITSITIHSGRMLLAYGFLKRIFEVFEKYKTPVDMVTTSEVSVSATIDDCTNLEGILSELSAIGQVEFRREQSIICIVGEQLTENRGEVSGIFMSIDKIPVRMISYGASKNSITFLVDSIEKKNTLIALQQLIPNQHKNNFAYA